MGQFSMEFMAPTGSPLGGNQQLTMERWEDAVRRAYADLLTRSRLKLDFGSGIIDRLGGAQIEGGRIRYFASSAGAPLTGSRGSTRKRIYCRNHESV